jgi:hypothetical protein
MVSGPVAVRGRLKDPLGIAAHQTEEFPRQHRDFSRVDPVRAEDGAPTAFGALIKIVEPLLENLLGQFPCSGKFSKHLSRKGEVSPIDGPQKFGSKDGHVLGIT